MVYYWKINRQMDQWDRIKRPEIDLYQISSVAQLCLTLCDPMNCNMPGLPVHHQF